MNVYVLYGPCFVHKLVHNQPNIAVVNQAQSTNHQPSNIISLEAQDPYHHLGLGTVQNRNLHMFIKKLTNEA